MCRGFVPGLKGAEHLVIGMPEGLMRPAICRRVHREEQTGAGTDKVREAYPTLFPDAGCSGLNKPDSGDGAGGFLYIRLHRLERDAEADVCGPLAATSIGWGRKYNSAAICRRPDVTHFTARDTGISAVKASGAKILWRR